MNYYIFQISDDGDKTANEWFKNLAVGKNVWGFGLRSNNRKAIQSGDQVIFYLTGTDNQVFVGSAELKSGAYSATKRKLDSLLLKKDTLLIDLDKVKEFSNPKPRRDFKSLGWEPIKGSSSRISERDYKLILVTEPDVSLRPEKPEEEIEFALEKYLEDFIWANWDKIDFGEKLTKFVDEEGNEGRQYYAHGEDDSKNAGYIDILAKDAKDGFVILELKKGRKNDEVVGQILRYIAWVRKNLAKKGEEVRGLVIVGQKDSKLELAMSEISDKVSAKIYKVSFRLNKYS